MKQNKANKAIAVFLVIMMVALIFIAGTYAKYTSQITGSDEATVAKWSWKINNQVLAKGQETYDLNLFDTILDTKDGNAETDVTSGKIAPGTKGEIPIKIENLSEVNAIYSLAFTEEKGTAMEKAKIEYSLKGGDAADDWTTDISTLNITDKAIAMEKGTDTQTIYWRWAYSEGENQDKIDTEIGMAIANATNEADKKITVKAVLTVTQVD